MMELLWRKKLQAEFKFKESIPIVSSSQIFFNLSFITFEKKKIITSGKYIFRAIYRRYKRSAKMRNLIKYG